MQCGAFRDSAHGRIAQAVHVRAIQRMCRGRNRSQNKCLMRRLGSPPCAASTWVQAMPDRTMIREGFLQRQGVDSRLVQARALAVSFSVTPFPMNVAVHHWVGSSAENLGLFCVELSVRQDSCITEIAELFQLGKAFVHVRCCGSGGRCRDGWWWRLLLHRGHCHLILRRPALLLFALDTSVYGACDPNSCCRSQNTHRVRPFNAFRWRQERRKVLPV